MKILRDPAAEGRSRGLTQGLWTMGVWTHMCQEVWCLSCVLDVTLRVVESLAEGCPTEHAVCAGLANRFDVATGAVIALDPVEHSATVTAWPSSADVVGMKVVLARLPQAFPLLLHHLLTERHPSCLSHDADPLSWHGTVAALLLHEVLGCEDIAQLPLPSDGARVRFAVLATHATYDERALHVLDELCEPLGCIIRMLERPAGTGPATPSLEPAAPVETDSDPGELPSLTTRELQVLDMVAKGMMARTVAARLAVSPRTVHKHLANAYRKLDAHDRLVAVRRAERLGLLTEVVPVTAPVVVPAQASPRDGALTLRW